jgi:hypothetical protein
MRFDRLARKLCIIILISNYTPYILQYEVTTSISEWDEYTNNLYPTEPKRKVK